MKIETLHLGTQTNPGFTSETVHLKAIAWKPKKTKSYTIENFQHTNYHGTPVEEETGYSSFNVSYFNTIQEGDHQVTS